MRPKVLRSTGKNIMDIEISILRIKDGKIVDEWIEAAIFGIL